MNRSLVTQRSPDTKTLENPTMTRTILLVTRQKVVTCLKCFLLGENVKLNELSTYTSSTLFIMGVAAAHSASALANSARPIREPTSLSLGLSLRNALEIIQPLNCTVGLPPVPKSFSSKGGSKLNGRAQPRLMHLGDLRCSKEDQPPGVES